jgi:hypothetical protein
MLPFVVRVARQIPLFLRQVKISGERLRHLQRAAAQGGRLPKQQPKDKDTR